MGVMCYRKFGTPRPHTILYGTALIVNRRPKSYISFFSSAMVKPKPKLPKLKITTGLPSKVIKYGMDGTIKKRKLAMHQAEKASLALNIPPLELEDPTL